MVEGTDRGENVPQVGEKWVLRNPEEYNPLLLPQKVVITEVGSRSVVCGKFAFALGWFTKNFMRRETP